MTKDSEKRQAAMWASCEKKLGGTLPQDFRTYLEAEAGEGAADEDIALDDLNGLMKEFMHKVELANLQKYFSSRKKSKDSASRKRYQRCFEKRLYIVSFIIGHRNPIIFEWPEAFALERFDWKQVCAKWNEAHPYDRMSPELLKVRYYRAIAEEDIQQEYLRRRYTYIPNLDKEKYIKAIEAAKEAHNERSHNQEV